MPLKRVPSIVIADEHKLLGDACRKMLQPEFEVVAVVTDGRTLVDAATRLKPDVGIINVSLPRLNGLDAADAIKRSLPGFKIVFLTTNCAPELAAEAFRHGASAYVLKQTGADELMNALHSVCRGQSYLSPLIARETLDFLLRRPKCDEGRSITGRQSEILQLLAEGLSMKQIAATLDITPGTVAFHKYSMMEKLGAASNAELLRYAIRHHVICA